MTAQQIFCAAAALVSLASCALHAFGGGALMARPFYRKAESAGVSTHAFRYCWHFVTLTLFATAAGYGCLFVWPAHSDFTIYLTANAIGISALSFLVSKIEDAPPFKSPPTILGAVISALGLAGLAAS